MSNSPTKSQPAPNRKLPKVERDAKIISMRELGYSLMEIAEATGVSTRTVKRVVQAANIPPGLILNDLVAKARKDAVRQTLSDVNISFMVTRMVQSSYLIQEKINCFVSDVIQEAEQSNDMDPLSKARAIASLANAAKLGSDGVRSASKLMPLFLILTEEPQDEPAITIGWGEMGPTHDAELKLESLEKALEEQVSFYEHDRRRGVSREKLLPQEQSIQSLKAKIERLEDLIGKLTGEQSEVVGEINQLTKRTMSDEEDKELGGTPEDEDDVVKLS